MAAYEALLRGRAKYQALIIDDFPEAARLYREAIRLEPDYAMAYAELAGVLANLARFRSGAERQSTVDELRDVAHRVMALAPDFHGSHPRRGSCMPPWANTSGRWPRTAGRWTWRPTIPAPSTTSR